MFLYGESSDSWIDFYNISSVVKKDNYYVVNMAGIYEYSDVGSASYWNDSGFNLIMRNLYQLMRFIKNIQINL